ncbi:MAG: ATP-dependent DNA helicase RecG [Candidatus Pacebacteria bacterium]|nr:ATP-dependent DNA helicase RecG [Candidatus Paceibacterota bacterium]MBP9840200.1 ATP-dependent DNA helicase RecG [Candidatus Paceibacterota bacterium]
MQPGDPVEKHFTRLRSDQRRALTKLGIRTVRDLLYHFPARYEAAGPTGTTVSVTPGTEVTLFGTIRKPDVRKTWKSRRPVAEAWLHDAAGKIKMMWFSQPYIAKTLTDGMVVRVTGRVAGTGAKAYLANPSIDRTPISPDEVHDTLFAKGDAEDETTLHPIYPESKGISSLWFTHAVRRALEAGALERVEDPLPEDLRERYHLPSVSSALVWIHLPQKKEDADIARKRFAFEEVFGIQLGVNLRKEETRKERALPVDVAQRPLADFVASFPFPPTNAQQRAIDEILEDFARPHPMTRLLEGDVGSGKTAVAAATAYLVATSRPAIEGTGAAGVLKRREAGHLQVAYMCPTEILAKQHFSTFVSYFKEHPIPIGLITGSECRKFPSKVNREESTKVSRAQFKKWVANGEIPIVIGTHALISKSLEFENLAYAIIDEQHRFGKIHRQSLVRKDKIAPHLLSMTATPIPRTLALTLYGDLDLSVLDEMPAGRKPVITKTLPKENREEAYVRVREELAKGHQAYVICPRIDEPDPAKELALQAKSVKAEAERLKREVFPSSSIGILHSKMKPTEKEEVMDSYARGNIDILVATSVVEVGVNVPNSTVILIEGAERFGLAQLHQLRGRVIRSTHQSYCFALPETYGQATKDRLKALTTAKDGFELAEYDLGLRGAGELYGARQWGVSDVAMEALKNMRMVEAARTEARVMVEKDPGLERHPLLAALAHRAATEMHPE